MKNVLNIKFEAKQFKIKLYKALDIIYFFFLLQITTVDQYWVWLENKLIPSLYASHYHNGTKIRRWWEKRCINDMASRRVGIPRLRQLRVKPGSPIYIINQSYLNVFKTLF